MLFFNDKDKFVEKECAFGIRFTRVDADANFNGLFTDISRDGVLLSTGFYDHQKENLLTTYLLVCGNFSMKMDCLKEHFKFLLMILC